jgi:amidase
VAGDRSAIDRNVYLGSPLSIQVVAPRLQERRLYDAMQVIDDAVHGRWGEAKL